MMYNVQYSRNGCSLDSTTISFSGELTPIQAKRILVNRYGSEVQTVSKISISDVNEHSCSSTRLRAIALTQSLLETLDELEECGGYRQRLKQSGKQFSLELDKFVSDVWKNVRSGDGDDGRDASKALRELMDSLGL